eukprot:975958-Pyramimonas_sp.AAC.1
MILDGVSLCRKLRHCPGDFYHCASEHGDYKMDKGGQMANVSAGQLCAEHVFMTAKLAALFFCQPSGGPAVQGGGITQTKRADGYTLQEAAVNEPVMHWQDWGPTEGNVPKSVLKTRPFE